MNMLHAEAKKMKVPHLCHLMESRWFSGSRLRLDKFGIFSRHFLFLAFLLMNEGEGKSGR